MIKYRVLRPFVSKKPYLPDSYFDEDAGSILKYLIKNYIIREKIEGEVKTIKLTVPEMVEDDKKLRKTYKKTKSKATKKVKK